jgi:lauroyl/myristoyl acyltransferase
MQCDVRFAAESGQRACQLRSGGFEVSIEEPLHPTDVPTSVENIAAAYAKRLEPFVLKHPDEWSGWFLTHARQIGNTLN